MTRHKAKSNPIPFSKFQAVGNDFIVMESGGLPRSLSRLASAICARTTGVGADGLLVITPARRGSSPTRLRFFNADGSEAEMSGNGIRCAAAYLAGHKLGRDPFKIATLAGVKTLHLIRSAQDRWIFHVNMGQPILAPAKIPFKGDQGAGPVTGFPIRAAGRKFSATVTSMGNPHCSILVDDLAALDWQAVGQEIEINKLFPNRTNVEFVKVISRGEIDVRFWERGVGKTMSSGTGSCAATVASILNGKTGRKVRVNTLAGTLDVEWPEGGEVTLAGPAVLIAHGVYRYSG